MTEHHRRLSVIVPTLNEAATLVPLLADLSPLRARGHQLIVVDADSRDDTAEIARPLVDHVLRSPPGRAAQMNAGAKIADGDVLWFVHADTRVPADAAAALGQALNGPRRWGRFDVRLSGTSWSFRLIERLMNQRSGLTAIATGDQGIFVERALFEHVGGFPMVALMEDIALSRLLRRHGRPAWIRQPRLQTSSRRWEQRGIAKTVWLMWRLRLAYAIGVSPDKLAERYR